MTVYNIVQLRDYIKRKMTTGHVLTATQQTNLPRQTEYKRCSYYMDRPLYLQMLVVFSICTGGTRGIRNYIDVLTTMSRLLQSNTQVKITRRNYENPRSPKCT